MFQGSLLDWNKEQFGMTPKDVKPTRPPLIDLEPTGPQLFEPELFEPQPAGTNLADPVVPEAADLSATTGSVPVGRIVHDARGNAVWKWRGESSSTGDTTSGVLKHIDPLDLSVEGQGSASVRPGASRARVPDAGGGYDPYNQGQPKVPAKAGTVAKPLPKKPDRNKR